MTKIAPKNTLPPVADPPQRYHEHVLTVRVPFHTLDALKRAARERSVTVSELVREHLPDKK